jgi:hypothetical protein
MTVDNLIEDLILKLTFEEKCGLLCGKNFWETLDIPRLSIPSVKVGHLSLEMLKNSWIQIK